MAESTERQYKYSWDERLKSGKILFYFSNPVARTQNSKLNEKMKVIEHIPGYSSWKTVRENEVAKYIIISCLKFIISQHK